jgi:uracil-DNA glycosylase
MPDERAVAALPIIIERLHTLYPNARYELVWETPVQLLVATILAAQCTDERVNQVTPRLFRKYPDAAAFAAADTGDLEDLLKPTGFYRQKAAAVQAVCRHLIEHFRGEVPRTIDEMVKLPGVARKTANVVLNNAFKIPSGVIVDTHVQRVSQRMGLSDQKKPEKIEIDLMRLVPKSEWVFFGPAMVLHGRHTCTFHQPACEDCVFNDVCPKRDVGAEQESEPMATKKTTPEPAAPSLREQLPADWQAALAAEFDKPYFRKLEKFVAQERASATVYPPEADVFAAFRATPFEAVKVLLLGQDPYHGAGEAHGLCFSVRPGVKVPPSLVNIFKEMQDDLGLAPPPHGCLTAWAERGVLLLNSVLTVRANKPASHKEQGWETFTDAVIKALSARVKPAVFLLWGNYAKNKAALIDGKKHRILTAGHPSPLSVKTFFGSKPFSGANRALAELGQPPIDWVLTGDEASRGREPPVVSPEPQPPGAHAPGSPQPALAALIPAEWRSLLADEVGKPSFAALSKFVAGERDHYPIAPAPDDVFAALRLTPPERVRVVILGTEPPCAGGVADGLAFSTREEADVGPVARTLFASLRDSLGCRLPLSGSLEDWARQGVLLLNSVLTVREGKPGSHAGKGWEAFTDSVLRAVNAGKGPVAFALWGREAQKRRGLIDEERHAVVTAEHPGLTPDKFLGANVFQEINSALELRGGWGVAWQLRWV